MAASGGAQPSGGKSKGHLANVIKSLTAMTAAQEWGEEREPVPEPSTEGESHSEENLALPAALHAALQGATGDREAVAAALLGANVAAMLRDELLRDVQRSMQEMGSALKDDLLAVLAPGGTGVQTWTCTSPPGAGGEGTARPATQSEASPRESESEEIFQRLCKLLHRDRYILPEITADLKPSIASPFKGVPSPLSTPASGQRRRRAASPPGSSLQEEGLKGGGGFVHESETFLNMSSAPMPASPPSTPKSAQRSTASATPSTKAPRRQGAISVGATAAAAAAAATRARSTVGSCPEAQGGARGSRSDGFERTTGCTADLATAARCGPVGPQAWQGMHPSDRRRLIRLTQAKDASRAVEERLQQASRAARDQRAKEVAALRAAAQDWAASRRRLRDHGDGVSRELFKL